RGALQLAASRARRLGAMRTSRGPSASWRAQPVEQEAHGPPSAQRGPPGGTARGLASQIELLEAKLG
ncbi:unnamed protein product, partial [Prorocentrum cordatum]